MENLINAVQKWLTHIMPDVVNTLLQYLTPETLADIAKEPAVHGPYSIDIEHLRAPITSIDSYVMAVESTIILAVTPTLRDAPEDYNPQLSFDMLFTQEDFATTIINEEHLQKLVEDVLVQYKSAIQYKQL